MNKITYTNSSGTYTIETNDDYEYLGDVFDYLIEPVLLAAGYQQGGIDKFLKNEMERGNE